jgi:Fe2+ or Zn2+ uptake regulation protein
MKPLRATAQRAAVLHAVEAVRDHPTAQQVFERVRRELPQVSLGTVYRNLDKLAREGRLRVLRLDSGAGHYDSGAQPHDHFVCDACGVVIDVEGSDAARGDASPAGGPRRIRRQSTVYFGSCERCADEVEDPRLPPPPPDAT